MPKLSGEATQLRPVFTAEAPDHRYHFCRDVAYAAEHGHEVEPRYPTGLGGAQSLPEEHKSNTRFSKIHSVQVAYGTHLLPPEKRRYLEPSTTTNESDQHWSSEDEEASFVFGRNQDSDSNEMPHRVYDAEQDIPIAEFENHHAGGDHQRPQSRKEHKALGRETQWRETINRPKAEQDLYVKATQKDPSASSK